MMARCLHYNHVPSWLEALVATWVESFPCKWDTSPRVSQMYPSELVNTDAQCFTVLLLNVCAVEAFFTTNILLNIYTAHTIQLGVYFLTRSLYLRTLGISSYLDSGLEMSCSHAIDVDRSRAHFSSMCCWSLRQNVQDVFWLPRIPGDIIIPSLSFPLSTPSALLSPSPPLGLYVLLYVAYSLYSIDSQEQLPVECLEKTLHSRHSRMLQ